jgi:pimeloyl-ACP methyl ester carboxylesterase
MRAPGYEIGVERADYDRFFAGWVAHWGAPETLGVPVIAPSQVGDEAFLQWWMRFERLSSTPRDMLATMALDADIDVREVLPAIRVPTLVVHARQDLVVPIEHGRYLAANIPGARLFEYDGEHLPSLMGADETWTRSKSLSPAPCTDRPATGCSPRWCLQTSVARPSSGRPRRPRLEVTA